MKNYFATKRGNAGIGERIKEESAGGVPSDGWERVADWALDRYSLRIRARLEAMGLVVDADGPLTVDAIKDAVRAKTGLDIQDLTPDGVAKALDEKLAREVSGLLRLEVSTVFDTEALKSEIKSQVIERVGGGSGAGVINRATLERLKSAATYARAGVVGDEKKREQARVRQKKYRHNHRQIWK
jgi:hypothetical protein